MYVHIGQDYMVPLRSIVCIFDMDTATASGRTRRLLERLSQEGRVVDLCGDLPKSAVLCTGELGEILYISQISSRTLQKRANGEWSIENGKGDPFLSDKKERNSL